MEFEKLIRERSATRSFSDKEVSDDLIRKILEAGNVAPTAKNKQPQRIYVVKTKEGIEKIDKVTPCRYNAPVCIIVAGDKSEAYSNSNGYSSYEMDASIVATHMMLEATNIGLDNIWIKMFDSETLKEEFKLDSNIEPVMIMPIGYRSENCPESPFHNIRKNIDDIVNYL